MALFAHRSVSGLHGDGLKSNCDPAMVNITI